MTTQHIATPAGPAGREERDPGAWVAPTIRRPVRRAVRDGYGRPRPRRLPGGAERVSTWIGGLIFHGGPLSVPALLTARLLPWKRRWSVTRARTAVLALLPARTGRCLVITLPAP
ncbi:hypothetical protein [Streptomyces sp. NPDC058145]|uniref:hypothetical protein n=1 Tax=Streptomyces sp. NPDC058145 TaxID=3346356 RepID=UPI0036F08973